MERVTFFRFFFRPTSDYRDLSTFAVERLQKLAANLFFTPGARVSNSHDENIPLRQSKDAQSVYQYSHSNSRINEIKSKKLLTATHILEVATASIKITHSD